MDISIADRYASFFLSISVFLLKQIVASHPSDARQMHSFLIPEEVLCTTDPHSFIHLMHDVRSALFSVCPLRPVLLDRKIEPGL